MSASKAGSACVCRDNPCRSSRRLNKRISVHFLWTQPSPGQAQIGEIARGSAHRPPIGRPSASIWTLSRSNWTPKIHWRPYGPILKLGIWDPTWGSFGTLHRVRVGPCIGSTWDPHREHLGPYIGSTWDPKVSLGPLHGVHLGPYPGSTWDPT